MRTVIGVLIIVAAVSPAGAQPVQGLYVAGGAGITLPSSRALNAGGEATASRENATSAAAATKAQINSNSGLAQSASAGWGVGNGLRFEVEGVDHAAP